MFYLAILIVILVLTHTAVGTVKPQTTQHKLHVEMK